MKWLQKDWPRTCCVRKVLTF